jgi:hypothetical protein
MMPTSAPPATMVGWRTTKVITPAALADRRQNVRQRRGGAYWQTGRQGRCAQ